MFRSKREERPKSSKSRSNVSLGIFDIPNIDGNMDLDSIPDDDDDGDLEEELLSIISSGPSVGPPRGQPRRKVAKPEPSNRLDDMVAASLRDVPSDESLSGDEDDPSLLAELNEVTQPTLRPVPSPSPSLGNIDRVTTSSDIETLLKERLQMYKEAEANAKAVGDTAKSRRLGRGLKTLSDLLKKAQRGVTIDESEIPLPVAKGAAKAPVASAAPVEKVEEVLPDSSGLISPLRPAPPVPPRIQISEDSGTTAVEVSAVEDKQEDAEKSRTLALLAARRDEYKKAAVAAKRRGDTQKALEHVKLLKQFEAVMAGVEAGQPFDLSTMPPPPSELTEASTPGPSVPPRRRDSEKQAASDPSTTPAPEESALQQGAEEEEEANTEPLSVLSALEQRLAKFREQEEAGKRDGNSSKARRMGRIVKQYEDAIKLHKAGRPIPVDELPTPPGFPPIPVESSEPVPSAAAPKAVPNAGVTSPTRPQVSGAPAGSSARVPVEPSSLRPAASSSGSRLPPPPSLTPSRSRSPSPSRRSDTNQAAMGGSSRVDRQLAALLVRQKELKEAALKAKRDGDIAKAKEFLKQAKGLDPLIQAANSGVRVDMSSIPIQPDIKESIDSEFDIVMLSDCLTGTDLEIYDQLVANLQTQFKLCMETRNHFKAIGDVANANRFEQLAVHTKNDLDMVRTSKNRNDPIPRFHYEKRKFSIVRCNVDLGDNDLELSILQGINYNVPNPKEVDTYVRFEFPLSNDETKKDKTAVIYNTNNPTYEAVFPITVQRNSRSFQRLFKRHSVKMEVWSRGGFLRSDTLIGTVSVKLQPLETKCTLHDSFDLMNGRKTVGGKLEVKIRIRHPILTKQVEQVEEKWLVID